MTITVNGQPRDLPANTTLESLIADLGLADAICAAERNNELVPKAQRESTHLQDGDTIEIVTLVGGG